MHRIERIKNSVAAHGFRGPSPRGEYQTCCPFCLDRVGKDDKSFKLQLNPRAFSKKTGEYGPLWYCYRCASAGSGDLSWLIEVPSTPVDPGEVPEWTQPPEGFEPLDVQSIVMEPYTRYLKNRGVLDQALAVGVGVCLAGKYGGRVVIPAKKLDGSWWGFSARTVLSKRCWDTGDTWGSPKYLYPRGMPRGTSLWGQDWVPHLKDKFHPIYVVEGMFDALALYPYGMALFGKSVSDAQLDLLAGLGRYLVICLDGDAFQDCQVLWRRLQARGAEASWCHLPPMTDPGTLGWAVRDYIVSE